MLTYQKIVIKIIKEQELIIGPVAWNEARKIPELKNLDRNRNDVNFSDKDPKAVIDNLVGQYENIFGRASREVCKEAAAPLTAELEASEVPSTLK